MERLRRPAQAGTLESCDILVMVAPSAEGAGITIQLESPVKKQYGRRIREVIAECLTSAGIQDAVVNANDRGALDCTIRARMETAIVRAKTGEQS